MSPYCERITVGVHTTRGVERQAAGGETLTVPGVPWETV